jgi:hypothetical protein
MKPKIQMNKFVIEVLSFDIDLPAPHLRWTFGFCHLTFPNYHLTSPTIMLNYIQIIIAIFSEKDYTQNKIASEPIQGIAPAKN